MKRIVVMMSLLLVCTGALVFMPNHEAFSKSDAINFVIIFPGGPDSKAESDNIINQFTQILSKMTGIRKSDLAGAYFNNLAGAKDFVKNNRDSYILGSLGFFLANKAPMKLVPLATIKLNQSTKEQYFLVIRKKSYTSLAQLKGKTLSGNVIYEDIRFINKIVFNGTIDASKHFVLKPTQRPLSAVRALTKQTTDAVLLNRMQYDSLKALPLFKDIEVLYTSPQVPALGFMMVDTPKTNSVKAKVVNTVSGMCDMAEGKDVCKNFGLSGFTPVKEGELDEVIKQFNNP